MKTYREHRCQKHHKTETTFLKCAIPRAAWIAGSGEYALIAWCSTPTVSLYKSREAALTALETLDGLGCGGRCTRRHALVKIEVT